MILVKRVYIDTSVVGGQFDEEFSEDTEPFFDSVIRGQFKIVVSDLLEAELVRAPEHVRDFLGHIPKEQIERVTLTRQSAELADNIFWQRWSGKPAERIASISR